MTECFSYATVSAALAKLFNIPEDRRTAWRGRLQGLRALGIPEETPGRGKTIAYSREIAYDMLIALELQACGLDPTLAAGLVRGEVGPGQGRLYRKRRLNEDIRRAARQTPGKKLNKEDAYIFVFLPDLLTVGWRSDPAEPVILIKPLKELRATDQLSDFVGPLERRTICFDLTTRLHALDELLNAAAKENTQGKKA